MITGLLGGSLGGFLMGRRKNRAEGDRLDIENVKRIIDIHAEEIERLDKRVQALSDELEECYRKHAAANQ